MEQYLDGATVLAADDAPDRLDCYGEWLPEGHDLRTARTGDAVLSALDDAVDVVVLDRNMPDLPAEVVLAELRDRGLDCRVAVVTGEPAFDPVAAGFDAALVEPVSAAAFREVLERLLRRAAYDDHLQELYSLSARQAVLEAELSAAERRDSEEYAAVSERVDALLADADRAVEAFADEDFDALFRDFAATVPEE